MKFSIICVYNNKNMFEDVLQASIHQQIYSDYELIEVDSNQHQFKSASEALNFGAKDAKGEFLVFVHQDVCLEDINFLNKLADYCSSYTFGIAGVAGLKGSKNEIVTYSNIVHGEEKHSAAKNSVDKPMDVDCIDECLMIIPNSIFKRCHFSNLGRTWHLYGADYSLKMKSNGYNVCILPLSLWHLSEGNSFSVDYFNAIKRVAKIYRKNCDMFYTFWGRWPTNPAKLWIKCELRKLRYRIKGI